MLEILRKNLGKLGANGYYRPKILKQKVKLSEGLMIKCANFKVLNMKENKIKV